MWESDETLPLLALLPSEFCSLPGTLGRQSLSAPRSGGLRLPRSRHPFDCWNERSQRDRIVLSESAESLGSSFSAHSWTMFRAALFSSAPGTTSTAGYNDGAWSGVALSV